MPKEARARIKINKLLEAAGWCFFDSPQGKANIALEPNVKLTQAQVDAMGKDFETSSKGFIDFLLLDEQGLLDNYKPSVVVSPDWPVVRIGDIFKTKSGTTPSRDNAAYFEGGQIPWVKTLDLRDGPLRLTDECVTDLALTQTHLEKLPVGTVLVAMYGGLKQIGRTGVLEIEATSNQAMTALLPTPQVEPYFLNVVLISQRDDWKTVANSTRKDPNITKSDVLNFKFPLPDLETQRAIVAEIEAEQALVNANRELIRRIEAKVKAAIDRMWGSTSDN